MKILHLTPPYGLGGIDFYVFNHYRHMDRERFKFTCMTQNRGLREAEEFQDLSFDVRLLPTTAAKGPELFANRVREILMEGYDVLHLHTSYWTGFRVEEIAREVGVPKVIVHAHASFIEEIDDEKRKTLLNRHEECKRSFPLELATDYWACSWKAADWLFGPQVPRDKIRIMKNAIEVERFRFRPEARKQIRTKLGLGNALVLGTVGRMNYAKNQAFLIDLFFEFQKRRPEAKLIIIGDGELRESLETQIDGYGLNGSVLLLGWKPDAENYLQAMDCFLLPSRFEGNPISLIEAAASGLPAIIADTITEEAVIANNIYRIPLEISRWLSALEQTVGESVDRKNGAEIIRNAGYDVKYQAKELERLYEALRRGGQWRIT